MKEYRDKSNRLIIELSAKDSIETFLEISNKLKILWNAQVINKIESPDQRYWDFKIYDSVLVLHSDTFCGISIHFEERDKESLLRSIAEKIMIQEETQNNPLHTDHAPRGG